MNTDDKVIARATVEGIGGYAQAIKTRHHELRADEPKALGGTDSGPAPFDLVLAGLGACTAITLRMYAERKQWRLDQVTVDLRLMRAGDANRIERTVTLVGALDAAQRAKFADIVERTPVTLALKTGMPITTQFAPGA